MSIEVTKKFTLVEQTCGGCGITFGWPDWYYQSRLDDHDLWWYCPNGCRRHFIGETKAQKLERELGRSKERERRARQDADHFEASRNAYKGQVTKIKKRVGNGVCPCCMRTFQNLMEHMKTKHPEFKEPEE